MSIWCHLIMFFLMNFLKERTLFNSYLWRGWWKAADSYNLQFKTLIKGGMLCMFTQGRNQVKCAVSLVCVNGWKPGQLEEENICQFEWLCIEHQCWYSIYLFQFSKLFTINSNFLSFIEVNKRDSISKLFWLLSKLNLYSRKYKLLLNGLRKCINSS